MFFWTNNDHICVYFFSINSQHKFEMSPLHSPPITVLQLTFVDWCPILPPNHIEPSKPGLDSFAVLDKCHCEGLRLRRVEVWERYCNLSLSARKKREMAPKIDGKYLSWPWTVVDRWLKLYNLPESMKGNFSSLLCARQSLCVRAKPGLTPAARQPVEHLSTWSWH